MTQTADGSAGGSDSAQLLEVSKASKWIWIWMVKTAGGAVLTSFDGIHLLCFQQLNCC